MQSKLHLDTDRKSNAFLRESRLLQVRNKPEGQFGGPSGAQVALGGQLGGPSGVQDARWRPKWRPHCACTSLTKRLFSGHVALVRHDKGPKWRLEASLEGQVEPKWRLEASLEGQVESKMRFGSPDGGQVALVRH